MTVDINFQNTQSHNYTIHIDSLTKLTFDTKVAIITNPTVSALHLETLKKQIDARELFVVTIPDGESYKNMHTIEEILNQLFEHKLDRKSVLIALGGGVIGDMTGFSASLYQRGITFVQVPTTLLSQVDASVGGKTGVNNTYGKNLIGAFYQPSAVYIDPQFLSTLPPREFAAGIAEIVKMAVTFDKDFFNFLETADFLNKETLKQVIEKSVKTKASVVEKDEKEGGIRAALNYGHTFAHVIENETKYSTYLHGEAVAIGMCMANELSVALGFMTKEEAQHVKNVLTQNNLPTRYEIKDVERFYEAFFLDKKSANDKITFVLAHEIGSFSFENTVPKETVVSMLRDFGGSK